MTLGIRARLFLASVAMILVVGLLSALILRRQLQQSVEERVHGELVRDARGARIAVEAMPVLDAAHASALVTRWSSITGVHLQLVSADGIVIADSAGASGTLPDLPEVSAALAPGGELGTARRASRLWVAVPFDRADGRGAVRMSQTFDAVDDAVRRLYHLLVIAAMIGLVVAVTMTWLASDQLSRAVRRLATGARELASGRTRRIEVEPGDELGDVGDALNHMAEDVDRTVAALARERALLGSMLESMSPGVVALDGDRRITLMNDAARALLRLDEAPIGEAFIDHVRVPALVDLVSTSEDAHEDELQLPGGVRAVARVAPQGGGGCILVLEDVTAVRRLETIRRDFVANVSHELRTPVAVISANAETLINGARHEPVMAGKLVDGIHRNAARMSRIIADLLSLSQIESGSYPTELEAVDLTSAVEQAVAGVDRAAVAGGNPETSRTSRIKVELPANLAATADPHALDHVLVNLLENALKYSPADGRIWVHAHAHQGGVRLEVRDEGPGIAPHHRERIFERFYRIDPGRSRALGGTGLGLSIVKHLVDSMGGRVGVDANQPRGSVFWVELAAAPAGNPVESPVDSSR